MGEWLNKLFRIQRWITSYNSPALKGDLAAGITTGMMLIPQGMAYAIIAGAPPIYGLYSGVIPLLIYPLFGTSRHISVGPVAIDMLIIAAAFEHLAPLSPVEYVGLAIMVTLLTGVTQIMMGVFRLGFVFKFFSRPVISGFTLAAPIIIGFSQIGNLMGIDLANSQFIYNISYQVFEHFKQFHFWTFSVGSGAVAFLLLMQLLRPKWPSSVMLVIFGVATSIILDLEAKGVELVGDIASGFPVFGIPNLQFSAIRDLLPSILTLAVIQFMGVASLGRAFAKRHDYLIDPNHELIAIGSSNIGGSFFSSLPVSASFSRSAASERAGGRTPMANVFTSVTVILSLLALTPLFYYLPLTILAAIIIISVLRLVDIPEIRFLFKTKRSEGLVALFTAFSTLLIGIQEGILLGVIASMMVIVFKLSRPSVAELGLIPGTRTFKNISRNSEAETFEDILILRVDAAFSFVNSEYFRDFILDRSEKHNQITHFVIIDGSTINDLDVTAVDSLKSICKTLHEWNIDLYFTGLKGPVRDVVRRSGLKEFMGEDHFCRSPHQAVQRVLEKLDMEDGGNRLQEYLKKTG